MVGPAKGITENTSILDFTGQSAIVTGGATGIGESMRAYLLVAGEP